MFKKRMHILSFILAFFSFITLLTLCNSQSSVHLIYWGDFCESISITPTKEDKNIKTLIECALLCFTDMAECRAMSFNKFHCATYDILSTKIFSVCTDGKGPNKEATFFARIEMNEDVKKLENVALFEKVKMSIPEFDPVDVPKKDFWCFTFPSPHIATDGIVKYDIDVFEKRTCDLYESYYDVSPWIRVDLQKEYSIVEIIIYNVGNGYESLLHDIEIQVGMIDIADEPNSNEHPFEQNEKCADIRGPLAPGPNVIRCDKKNLSGRFVSVQIVGECTEDDCKYPTINKIAIAEIEVWSFPPEAEINRAFLKPTFMTSHLGSFHSKYAVDGYTSISPIENDRPVSVSTLGQDPGERPWLQIDLLDSFEILKVILFIPDIGHHGIMHDVEVQVGIEDTSKLSNQNPLYYTPTRQDCRHFHDRILTEGRTVVNCRKELFGRFVTVQVTQNCSLILCSTYNNRLVVSEVEVLGKLEKSYSDPISVAFKKYALLSSTAGQAIAAYTVDGKFNTNASFCSQTKGDDPYPWWRVDLGKEYIVEMIGILNRIDKARNSLRDIMVQVGYYDISNFPPNIRFVKNEICAATPGSVPGGWNEFTCEPPRRGYFVNIQIAYLCLGRCTPEENNQLTLCEVEVQGSPIPVLSQNHFELVYYAQVAQSTTHSADVVASLTIDGFTDIERTDKSVHVCSSTTKQPGVDNFPWWRIDMFQERVVHEVVIYNKGENEHKLLHDFDIRVGMEDIANIPAETLFSMNTLCISQRNTYILPGALNYLCEKPVLGRFVSIQIVENCQEPFCEDTTANILSLCEVFVWGEKSPIGMEIEIINDALFRPTAQSSTLSRAFANLATNGILGSNLWNGVQYTCSSTDPDIETYFPWWRVDLVIPLDVQMVDIANAGTEVQNAFHDMEIRVGYDDIAHFPPNSIFLQNTICVYYEGFLRPGRQVFLCREIIRGRFVSIQIVNFCTHPSCFGRANASSNVLSLCEVGVMGSRPVQEMKPTFDSVSLDKHALQSSSITGAHRPVECFLPPINFVVQIENGCSLTRKELYPWWMVDLGTVYIVYGLAIDIPFAVNDEPYNPRIAVRVGHWSVALEPLKKEFEKNLLCGELRRKQEIVGLRKLRCIRPIIGQYVSLQVLPTCDDKGKCPESVSFLLLCRIEVYGMKYIPY